MKKGKKTLLVIAGPTAVGKTDLAILLAKQLKTEIISADSRQFFREMEIGTAKPSATALQEASHHFINSHSITETYDAAQFAKDAHSLLTKIFEYRDVCILCGGSGLYIKAVCEGFDDIPAISDDIRQSLIMKYESHGIEWLQAEMKKADPEYYEVLDRHNPHRLIRALEVKIGTGKSLSSFFAKEKSNPNFNTLKIGLELPRDLLYEKIDKRMDLMIGHGLFEEAKALINFREHQALQTVGYKEIFDYLDGQYDLEEAIRLLKRNSRRYAKRQLTWFKKDKEFVWFDARNQEEILGYIDKHLTHSDE
ncbi:MAG TPA: tRNA (adenosine(37)-N6)-dimethylallyltransferase MiaA [Chryseosolibacter sp.]